VFTVNTSWIFIRNCNEVIHQTASIRNITVSTNAHEYTELSLYTH
jgi:hypothetical protein